MMKHQLMSQLYHTTPPRTLSPLTVLPKHNLQALMPCIPFEAPLPLLDKSLQTRTASAILPVVLLHCVVVSPESHHNSHPTPVTLINIIHQPLIITHNLQTPRTIDVVALGEFHVQDARGGRGAGGVVVQVEGYYGEGVGWEVALGEFGGDAKEREDGGRETHDW